MKRKRKKEKHHVNWKKLTATSLIVALSATSLSLESFAAGPVKSAETPAQTGASASENDELVERPAQLKGITGKDVVKKENTETSTTFQVGSGKKVSVFY